MRASKRLALVGLVALSMYLLAAAGFGQRLGLALRARIDAGRMKNVSVSAEPAPQESAVPVSPSPSPAPAMESPASAPLAAVMESLPMGEIRETTIQGGLEIKNETGYAVDTAELLSQGPALSLPAGEVQILIIHTHGSEAYTQAGLDRYEAQDNMRTADTAFNIVRVGDELAAIFQEAGLGVIHDREIYDYPSYTGSYSRSGAAAEDYLRRYPGIRVILDVHRDALGADGVIYKTVAEEKGVCASQVMLLVGTDESGLEHPNWRSNLALALYLQDRVSQAHPTLMRPVSLVRERYNQHLSPGSLIIEVGSSGNTLQEALAAIRLFARAAAPALKELAE